MRKKSTFRNILQKIEIKIKVNCGIGNHNTYTYPIWDFINVYIAILCLNCDFEETFKIIQKTF